MNEKRIKSAWDKLNPTEESKQKIMYKIAGQHQRKRRLPFKTLLLAGAICLLSVASVAAYTGYIQDFLFGSSRARQVEYVENPNRTQYVHYFHGGVYQGSQVADADYFRLVAPGIAPITYERPAFATLEEALLYAPFISFLSMEEAQYQAPFPLRQPIFMPENTSGDRILLLPNADGTYAPIAHMQFTNVRGTPHFWLKQSYVGPEGYFIFESEHGKEKVMIGDIEALFVERQRDRELMWIADGVFFSLGNRSGIDRNGNNLGLNLETMVRIAESIR